MVYGKRARRRIKRRFHRRVKRPFSRYKRKMRWSYRKRATKRPTSKRAVLRAAGTVTIGNFLPRVRRAIHLYEGFYTSSPGNQLAFILAESSLFLTANSLYDPNQAVTGKYNVSAGLYRYMAVLYGRYRVYRSTVKFSFKQLELSGDVTATGRKVVPCYVGIIRVQPSGGTAYTDYTQLIEDKRRVNGRWIYLSCDENVPLARATVYSTFNERIDLAGESYGDDTHGAAVGSNPTRFVTYAPFYAFPDPQVGFPVPRMGIRFSMKQFTEWSQPAEIDNLPAAMDPTEIAN